MQKRPRPRWPPRFCPYRVLRSLLIERQIDSRTRSDQTDLRASLCARIDRGERKQEACWLLVICHLRLTQWVSAPTARLTPFLLSRTFTAVQRRTVFFKHIQSWRPTA